MVFAVLSIVVLLILCLKKMDFVNSRFSPFKSVVIYYLKYIIGICMSYIIFIVITLYNNA